MAGFLARAARLLRGKRAATRVESVAKPGDDTHNSGLVQVQGSAAALPRKTVIVLGVARGGTSMAAGALAHLGIYMGQTSSAYYEDIALSDCFNSNDYEGARKLAAGRSTTHAIWGFKKPRIELLTRRWQGVFGEPVYVVVLRDPLAVANRRAITYADDFFDNLDEVLRQQRSLLAFVRKTDRPCLLVSYEKALLDPELFVASLAGFLGLSVDSDTLTAAANFVAPSPETYRRHARVDTPRSGAAGVWRGHLERVGPDAVAGWAFAGDGSAPVTVELLVNNVRRSSVTADISRRDVSARFELAGEHCGFVFPNDGATPWQAGDYLAVRLAGEEIDINNSPQVCRV